MPALTQVQHESARVSISPDSGGSVMAARRGGILEARAFEAFGWLQRARATAARRGLLPRRAAERAERAAPMAPRFAPHAGPLPKTMWAFWSQGADAAPEIIRFCLESWARMNPGWELRVLDDSSARTLLDLSDLSARLPLAKHANIIKARVLAQHGGVWIGASTLCHRPLDQWLPPLMPTGFFVFADPGVDRIVANWFIAARPGNPLIVGWEQAVTGYWGGRDDVGPFYSAMHYLFHWRVLTDAQFRRLWRLTPRLSAHPTHLLQDLLTGAADETPELLAVAASAPVSKITWKRGLSIDALEALLGRVDAMRHR